MSCKLPPCQWCFSCMSLLQLFGCFLRTCWMVDLAHDADARPYFKFLFIFVLYTLAMTLFNLLRTLFHNGESPFCCQPSRRSTK
ncbi:hypothetical protein C8J56DRAFT_940451 [Mycena floridula]|nr:hypothetical protein C8J56DRAFT_941687 [Mycena floridula]KAJ7589004.1 hypothetical protein C8J56DRAFT_940451 [Mycena floridula]